MSTNYWEPSTQHWMNSYNKLPLSDRSINEPWKSKNMLSPHRHMVLRSSPRWRSTQSCPKERFPVPEMQALFSCLDMVPASVRSLYCLRKKFNPFKSTINRQGDLGTYYWRAFRSGYAERNTVHPRDMVARLSESWWGMDFERRHLRP